MRVDSSVSHVIPWRNAWAAVRRSQVAIDRIIEWSIPGAESMGGLRSTGVLSPDRDRNDEVVSVLDCGSADSKVGGECLGWVVEVVGAHGPPGLA